MTALCMLSRPGHLLCRHGALERPEREAAGQVHQRASRGQQTAGQHCCGHQDCAISLAPHSWAVCQCLQVHYSMNRHGLTQAQCSNADAVPPHSNPRGGPRQASLVHRSGSELALWTHPQCPSWHVCRLVRRSTCHRASLKRVGRERLALGQLHWSTANYQPLQERALWDGLAAMHDQVRSAPRRCLLTME